MNAPAYQSNRLRRRLLFAVVVLAMLAGSWFWLFHGTLRLAGSVAASRLYARPPLVSQAGVVVWLKHGENYIDPALLGWDGRIRWRADMRLHVQVAATQAISPDGHLLAGLLIFNNAVTISTWRDGKLVSTVSFPVTDPVYDVFADLVLYVDNDGRVLACVSTFPEARVLEIREGRIVARGACASRLPESDDSFRYRLEFSPDGSALIGAFKEGNGQYDNLEYFTLAVSDDRIRITRKFACMVNRDLSVLPDGSMLTSDFIKGNLTDILIDAAGQHPLAHPFPYSVGQYRGNARCVVSQEMDRGSHAAEEYPKRVSPPRIIDRRTGATWSTATCRLWLDDAIASDDGRFAVLYGCEKLSGKALCIFEQPGRLCTRLPLTELHRLSTVNDFYLSPDGHSLVIMNEEHGAMVYRW